MYHGKYEVSHARRDGLQAHINTLHMSVCTTALAYFRIQSAGLPDDMMIITCMIHLLHLAVYKEIPQFWMQDTKRYCLQSKKHERVIQLQNA